MVQDSFYLHFSGSLMEGFFKKRYNQKSGNGEKFVCTLTIIWELD